MNEVTVQCACGARHAMGPQATARTARCGRPRGRPGCREGRAGPAKAVFQAIVEARADGAIGPDHASAIPVLLRALPDDPSRADARGRAEQAFDVVVGPGAEGAVSSLVAALNDRREYVRAKMIDGLISIGPGAKRALPNLRVRATTDESDVVKERAQLAIDTIGSKN